MGALVCPWEARRALLSAPHKDKKKSLIQDQAFSIYSLDKGIAKRGLENAYFKRALMI